MKKFADLAYGTHDLQKLDVYCPDGSARAALIYIHGGGITAGEKDGQDCVRIAEDLTAQGVAMISINYRLFPEAKYPEFIEDCAAAAKWTFDHAGEYGLSEKIYLGGSSAGAYLTGMLCFDREFLAREGLEPERFAGFVLDAGQPTTHFNVLQFRGDDPRRCVIDETAILYHITDARPGRPLLVLYADNDMPCRPEQNRLMIATLKHFGYDANLIESHEMKGFSHCQYVGMDDENGKNLLASRILEFLDHTL